METKQTAVQWLYDELSQCMHREEVCDLVYKLEQKAKQMEREQIISNYCKGFEASAEGWNGEYGLKDMRNISEEIKAEKYYNETYGEKFGENYGGKDE